MWHLALTILQRLTTAQSEPQWHVRLLDCRTSSFVLDVCLVVDYCSQEFVKHEVHEEHEGGSAALDACQP